ncbi:hypothetical protein [Natrinema salaciae]|uniref:Uncharacterized protein n=1 Tax=Natrinema salaciae TaxID=1186196 RepID=A0A1H9F9I9_9EURY|nr:hypothetical protein [Natrinema salaciae]SEQ34620.1 hypothetical protein SAMN04489841_1513 [Natrinema salaciae]
MVQDDDGQVLLFTYDYESGEDFEVVSQLETGTTVRILQTADGETVSEISQPDEYTGHVVRLQAENGPQGPTILLFTRDESYDSGDSGTLGEDAQIFSSQLNLLSTSLE